MKEFVAFASIAVILLAGIAVAQEERPCTAAQGKCLPMCLPGQMTGTDEQNMECVSGEMRMMCCVPAEGSSTTSTAAPAQSPTLSPTESPAPTGNPTVAPTDGPTEDPTEPSVTLPTPTVSPSPI